MGLGGSKPEDIQSSKEAQEIADRLVILAESAAGDDSDEIFVANQFVAANRYFAAARYYKRAEELRKQGK